MAFKIKNEVDDGLSRNLIQPQEETFLHWKVTKFQYTDKGVTDHTREGEYATKKSWHRASLKIQESIRKSKEYSSVLETEMLGSKDRRVHNIESFVMKLVSHRLYEARLDETDIDLFIATFLKDLNEEPLKYGADVELDGIAMQPERIELRIGDTNVVLRQTKIEDLEQDIPVYGFPQPRLRTPSAILNIDFLGRQANEIQIKVNQAIAILRLFKVGSVTYISCGLHSESITDIGASRTFTPLGYEKVLETSVIIKEDIKRLKKFWQTMIKALPEGFYEVGETRSDHLLIAYKRYCDALLQNGLLERRIANVVMGLESLFLKGTEIQELTYRLGIRIAKILSLLEYNPHKVKEFVQEGYKIRNLFVHGSHLSYKEKRKLSNKYGDTKSFLLFLLDYLRISIVLMMFIKKEKEEFLDLIDDSLVDKDKDSQLNNMLGAAKNVILSQ